MTTDTLEPPVKNRVDDDGQPRKRPKNRGNFANDPQRAREAGRKGGRARGKTRP